MNTVTDEELKKLWFKLDTGRPTTDALAFARAAIEAHEARKVPDGWRSFVERVAGQKPEKPDYWSACGQCEHNISDAEDLLASAPPAPQASVVKQEPLGFIFPKQVERIVDPGGEFGTYIPMRKTPAGSFTLAVYTHPAPVREPLTDRIEHLERVLVQAREALQEILNDTQHAEHFCGAECPVTDARAMVVTIDEALKG